MFLNNTADKLVFKFLNKINYGYLKSFKVWKSK